jgi:hypothetical protein
MRTLWLRLRRPDTIARVIAVIALPLTVALASLHRGHHGDQAVFQSWYDVVKGAPSRMYLTPRRDVNYPVLGVAVAVAPGMVAPAGEFGAATKLLLVPWNVLLIIAFAGAARGLRFPRPHATAMLFYLLPANWVCALYFGQIDGVTVALQLVVAWAGVALLISADELRRSVAWFVVALAALQASLLTKQLAAFAAPGLIMLLMLGLLAWHRSGHRRAAWLGLGALALSFAVLRLPDAFLTLPAGYHSHLALVFLGAGPAHSEMIGNAPGVFAFTGLASDASSLTLLAPNLTARSLGRALFAVFVIVLTVLFARAVRRMLARREPGYVLAGAALLYAGLLHLGVALLIAGAHERYLFNAFPLMALGLGVRRDLFARCVEVASWGVAAVYGMFVLSTIEWNAFAPIPIFRSTRLCAVLSLTLLCAATLELMMRGNAPTTGDPLATSSRVHRTRDFAIFMVIAMSLGSVFAFRRGVALPLAVIPGVCGAVLGLLAIVRPAIVRPIAEAWATLGHLLGRVTTPIMLSVVFAVVVVPLGMLLRVLGKDVLKLRRDPTASTYWIERKRKTFERGDFERLS